MRETGDVRRARLNSKRVQLLKRILDETRRV
jgi:hypothetical protein